MEIEIAERGCGVPKRRHVRDLVEAFDYLRACYSRDSTLKMNFLLTEAPPAFRRRAVSYVIPYYARVTFFAEEI